LLAKKLIKTNYKNFFFFCIYTILFILKESNFGSSKIINFFSSKFGNFQASSIDQI